MFVKNEDLNRYSSISNSENVIGVMRKIILVNIYIGIYLIGGVYLIYILNELILLNFQLAIESFFVFSQFAL